MKVYLINLDRDKERLVAADAQLKRLGVAYERVSAVYAKELPQAELDAAVDKFRWWCSTGRQVRVGEIGCAMSHRTVYKKMRTEGVELACVLEDDVLLSDRFVEALAEIERRIGTERAAIVQLGNRWNPPCDCWGLRRVAREYGTYAYVINARAAEAMLRYTWPMKRPCDHWHEWQKWGLELWQFTPAVGVHDDSRFCSGISPKGSFLAKELPLWKWMIFKFGRLLGKTIDGVARRWEGRKVRV